MPTGAAFLRRRAALFFFLPALGLAGCAFSSAAAKNIQPGMTETQVTEVMGPPAYSEDLGYSRTLAYFFPRNAFSRGALFPWQKPYTVYLEDGRVAAAGKGIRKKREG